MRLPERLRRRVPLPAGLAAIAPGIRSRLPAVLATVLTAVRPVWQVTTPVGRAAAAVAAGAWLLGLRLGWQELFLIAACATIALLAAVGFVLGRPAIDMSIELDPARVTVGAAAVGRLLATNRSRARLRPLSVELPVGGGLATFHLPSLARDAQSDEIFVVPTERRAVITIGPARAVRTDPLGLLRRDAAGRKAVELFVHPRIIGLSRLGAGLQRDLDGQTTRDLSTSDLAFHTLREYVPGDDRRYVHWLSTAKHGKLLVRQFQDTRRSRLTLVVDGCAASYTSADEFEVAMSAAGSIGVRAAQDRHDVCVVVAGHATRDADPVRILDTLARSELTDQGQDLATLAGRASRLATDTSVLMLLTGSVIPFRALQAAAIHFGPDVKVMALRIEPDAPPGISESGGMTVLALRTLADLPLLLSAGGQA
jgi:uncharacterized protein (DUF58 family)